VSSIRLNARGSVSFPTSPVDGDGNVANRPSFAGAYRQAIVPSNGWPFTTARTATAPAASRSAASTFFSPNSFWTFLSPVNVSVASPRLDATHVATGTAPPAGNSPNMWSARYPADADVVDHRVVEPGDVPARLPRPWGAG
jgi:hypothetical protein